MKINDIADAAEGFQVEYSITGRIVAADSAADVQDENWEQDPCPESFVLDVLSDLSIFVGDLDALDRIKQEKCLQIQYVDESTLISDANQIMHPKTIGEIYNFHETILKHRESSPQRAIMIHTCLDDRIMTSLALLLAGHLIFGLDMTAAEVSLLLDPISSHFLAIQDGPDASQRGLSLHDCIEALCRSRSFGWVRFHDPDIADADRAFIDMDEYLHYDDGLNGAMHLVDPSRLLLLRRPTDLPDDRTWVDDDQGNRLFGPAHYAALLPDFDVTLLVRLGPAHYDDAPLLAAGIGVEDMPSPCGPGQLLVAADRFLTLCRLSPGCVALDCGDDSAGWMLAAAYLIRVRGFRPEAALAWARMAHPMTVQATSPILIAERSASPPS